MLPDLKTLSSDPMPGAFSHCALSGAWGTGAGRDPGLATLGIVLVRTHWLARAGASEAEAAGPALPGHRSCQSGGRVDPCFSGTLLLPPLMLSEAAGSEELPVTLVKASEVGL